MPLRLLARHPVLPPSAVGLPAGAFPLLVVALLLAQSPTAQAAPAPVRLDCENQPCSNVLRSATRFRAPPDGGSFAVGLDAAGETVGWVALSTDVVDIPAYSGKPLVTLVGLDTTGVITGARVIHHSEPILLVGIPEQKLHDFADFYAGKVATAKVVVGSSPDPKAVTVDVISGATVTALAMNKTVLDTARGMGVVVGVIPPEQVVSGHWIDDPKPWTFQRMLDERVLGNLRVMEAEMGLPTSKAVFVDIWFTIADAPHIGISLFGANTYRWLMKDLKPGEHLLAVVGNGSYSFKGSGFVRGGIFDRIKLEQGLRSVMFRDHDYTNLSGLAVADATRFNEGAIFRVRAGLLNPGQPFDLVFIGSRYDGVGAFSRDFHAFSATHRLPASLYHVDETADGGDEIWRQAWYNHRLRAAILIAFLVVVMGLFAGRRFLTGRMPRLRRIHLAVLLVSFFGAGVWLHAQPSVTQVLTLVDASVGQWRWGLFLSEPLLFISWTFIAIVTVIWGRGVFCGWTCPYGSLTELLFKLGKALRLPELELPDAIHLKLRWLRYVVLLVLVGSYLYSPQLGERLAEVEPFKTTFFVVPWTRQWWFLLWWVALLVWSVFAFRPFCRYICPLGAALAMPSSVRISGPYRRKFCDGCGICPTTCEPRAIRADGTIDSRECLSCMECEANYRDREVCPPLVGIDRLMKRAADQGVPANADKLARLRTELEDM